MSGETGGYDVFLSYSRADSPAAEALRARLKEAGLSAFLDRYSLPSGQPWQPWLEQHLGACRALLALIGPSGLGEWQQREIQVGLSRQVSAEKAAQVFPVIPVLLPGLANDAVPIGRFLKLNTWIDLRAGLDDIEGLQRLIAGAQGQAIDGAAAEKRLAGLSPYRGLLPFREQDVGLFFGRWRFVEELVQKVRRRTETNVVAVIGRSGSGKSSIVYAGLLPALRHERGVSGGSVWQVLDLRPHNEPLHQLAAAFDPPNAEPGSLAYRAALNEGANVFRERNVTLAELVRDRLRKESGSTRLLFYVDQWEELYTQATPREIKTDADRARAADAKLFIDLVLDAAASAACSVVFSVRSDFYPDIQTHDGLRVAVQESQVSLGTMNEAELCDVIEGPPKALGATVDRELTKKLVRDIGLDPASGRSDEYDIGKLPLLEYALEQTWARRTGLRVRLVDYSGLEQALEERANALYERLSPEEQAAAKRLFVSLVTPGEGREDTRARIAMPNNAAMRAVIETFAGGDARLIVTDEAGGRRSVEVSHEALIRHWDKLRAWIDENRDRLRTREFLRANRAEWLKHHGAPGLLDLPSLYVEAARSLHEKPGDVVIDDIEDYVEALLDHDRSRQEDERQKVEAEQRKELELERALAAQEKRRAWLVGAASLFAAVAIVIGSLYYYHLGAVKAKEAQKMAEAGRITTLARDALWSDGPATAILVASRMQDVGLEEAAEAERLLLTSLHELREERVFAREHTQMVNGISYSPDGGVLVTSDPASLLFSDAASGDTAATVALSDAVIQNQNFVGPFLGAQWSPVGNWIAAGSRDQTLLIAPCSHKELKDRFAACAGRSEDIVQVLGNAGDRTGAAKFSADGTWMATGGFGTTVKLWDVSTVPIRQLREFRDPIAWPNAFAISPDKRWIASGLGQSKGEIKVSDASSGSLAANLDAGKAQHGSFVAIEFNPVDPRMLAASASDGSIFLWKDWSDAAAAHAPEQLEDARGMAFQIAFSADGGSLIGTSDDGVLRMWASIEGERRLVGEMRGHKGPVWTIAFSPDGNHFASGSTDGSLISWSRQSAFHVTQSSSKAAGEASAEQDPSLCAKGLKLPREFGTPVACVQSPGGRIVVASANGQIEEFHSQDGTVAVDSYRVAPGIAALKLDGDRLIVEMRSGEWTEWPFFDSLKALIDFSLAHLPYDRGERVKLSPEILCRIDDGVDGCVPNATRSFLERR